MEKNIDFVKILCLGRKGLGPIIAPCLTIILAPLGFLYSLFYCTKVKIHKTPTWYIGDNLHLGYALFWGSIILSLGFLFIMGYFIDDTPDDLEVFFYSIGLPFTLSGFSIILYQFRYKEYKGIMNALLGEIAFSQTQEKRTLEENIRINIIRPSASFNLTEMLDDLKKNAVINYNIYGDSIHIEVLSPTLKEYCFDENDPSLYEEWECRSCGANNRVRKVHAENIQCVYCGTEKLSSAESPSK